jgi:hypothetical protein
MENNILVNIKAWITAALATVTAVQEGGVTLLIDGETEASQMVCACLASYTPAAGDRVFFQRVGGAMLVLGKI